MSKSTSPHTDVYARVPEFAILVTLYVQTVLFLRARRTDARMNELMEQHLQTRAGCGR
jgi:hypothetical protein